MSPPETATPDSGTGGADYLTTTNTPKDGAGITSTDATSFGAMLDRPLTTTRRCEGAYCWCQVGSMVTYPHWQYMDTLAREIRLHEVAQGPVL